MSQEWFEMKDIRNRNLESVAWIPLRSAQDLELVGQFGFVRFRQDRLSVGSLAVPADRRSDALTVRWGDVGTSHDHAGYVCSGEYVQADVYEDIQERFLGIHLVLNQRGVGAERPEWHLHQDFVVTLGLTREEDSWVRPEEAYVEVARIKRAPDGSPALLEVRASHLRDYLCARSMGLVVSSFRKRSEITEDAAHISWSEDGVDEEGEHDCWRGHIMAIHEGGRPYGHSVHVIQVARTDVNPEDDIPVLAHPTEASLESTSWTKSFSGRKLYLISGELWRTEWLGPASQSPIVRRDKLPSSVSFIIDAEGGQASGDELVDSHRWLWFRPTLIPALLARRGSSLQWYSRNTAGVAFSSGHDVHFGISDAGLVNAYAREVALLPEWLQREWAAHNAYPEGKLSEELKAPQVYGVPALTQAPEALLSIELGRLQELAQAKLKIELFRRQCSVAALMPRIHRFQSTDSNGLFALAKDVTRMISEALAKEQLQQIVTPPKSESWGSLKSLEKVLASKIDPADARAIVGPLVGVYKLRLEDAHLPSGDLDDSMKLRGVDASSPFVVQGYQLLDGAVTALHQIGTVIDENW